MKGPVFCRNVKALCSESVPAGHRAPRRTPDEMWLHQHQDCMSPTWPHVAEAALPGLQLHGLWNLPGVEAHLLVALEPYIYVSSSNISLWYYDVALGGEPENVVWDGCSAVYCVYLGHSQRDSCHC